MPDLRERRLQPEDMDRPDLGEADFVGSLRALERINWWSGSAGILWPAIRDLAATSSTPLRVLDIATGAGDVPIRLWHKAQHAGIALHVEGCDRKAEAVRHAASRAQQAGASVRYFQLDAVNDPLPDDFDIIATSLFLHHLNEEEAVDLLGRMAQAARRLVLVNDLVRSALGFFLARLGTLVLTRSWVAHLDGPRSVEGAFTPAEASRLAERAGLAGATIARHFPCRFLLAWSKPA